MNNDAKISEAFKAITNVLILKRPGNTRTPLDRLKSANTDLKDRIQNLPTRTHYAWVLRPWSKDNNLTRQGQFLTPDPQIRTNFFLAHDYNENSIQFHQKCSKNVLSVDLVPNCILHNTKIVVFLIASEVLKSRRNIFVHRKSSQNRRNYSEVARMFSENPVMTRWKSHAFDSEKVGGFSLVWIRELPKSALYYWTSELADWW